MLWVVPVEGRLMQDISVCLVFVLIIFIYINGYLQDGRISYEEFSAMMKSGTDWRKASRQYSRDRYNNLSLSLMRDTSVKVKDEIR